MTAQELRNKSVEELMKILKDLYKEKFNLRMLSGTGNNPKQHLFRKARVEIARIKTVLSEKGKSL